MKKIISSVFAFCAVLTVFGTFAFSSPTMVRAEDAKLNVYFFWGEGCPHCAKEEQTLKYFESIYPDVEFYDFEVYKNPENVELFKQTAEALGTTASGVPFTVIGDKAFVGFSETISPKILEERIKECLANICPDSVASITGVTPAVSSTGEGGVTENTPLEGTEPTELESKSSFEVPVMGKIDAKTVSLPLLSIVLGVLDGFNPCAMWTLLFLISLLLGMEDRKRMWILGSAFIIASASVYFVFMAAWLNFILFVGFVFWVRIAIGALALGGGIYSVRKFFTTKPGTCEVATGGIKREKVFEKLKEFSKHKNLIFALLGIIALAFAVNLVELVCSAGLPAVFTQVLALNSLPSWQYYLYLLLYIFFFMIDDLFVFFVAMITLKMTGITSKYTHYSSLVGGILMFLIGLLLFFKPEWLMFG